jgi:hypothetical protein
MEGAIRLGFAFAMPGDEHVEFIANPDLGATTWPLRYEIERAAVKFDYFNILYQRRLWTKAMGLGDGERWASQFGGDSSPQTSFDPMNSIEERFVLGCIICRRQ